MRSDEILETLIEIDVLEPSDDETLSVTTEFQTAVDDVESSLERRETVRDGLRERFDDRDVVRSLTAIGDDDLAFVAHYCALTDRTTSLSHDDLVRTVAVLMQLSGSPPRTEGVPDHFLPVHGEQLPTLLQLTDRAILYVWQEDCEPCDIVRETFEALFEGGIDDIALFAVYGPEWAELLYEQFDVSGAPAALFVLDGDVDSRLYGAHYPEAYEGEVEKIRELAPVD